MPLQNRVAPWGQILAVPARGTFMGNRGGALHNENREIVREYASRRWITCLLEFRGRRRTVMSPNRYTELFFLDEAVAFAAGHRPCAECRRECFNAFKTAWCRAHGLQGTPAALAEPMDLELHRSRINQRKAKISYRGLLDLVPDGSFIRIAEGSYLVWGDSIYRWSFEGYNERRLRPRGAVIEVLTPEAIVKCLSHGYRPNVHESLLTL